MSINENVADTKEKNLKKSGEISFISYLSSLNDRDNRGALADLRKGLNFPLGKCIDMYPYVLAWVKNLSSWKRKVHFLIAQLFAFHPEVSYSGNMGDVYRQLADERNEQSMEQRFIVLLKCDPNDLDKILRQAISLAKSQNIAINWNQLYKDLMQWPFESKYPPQERWANSFWKYKGKNEENNNESNS